MTHVNLVELSMTQLLLKKKVTEKLPNLKVPPFVKDMYAFALKFLFF